MAGPLDGGGGGGDAELAAPFARLPGALKALQDRAVAEAVQQAAALLRDHYALYHRAAPGGGGGWTLLEEHEVGSTAELTITLPASGTLPQTYASLVLELRARSDATGTTRDNLTLEVNSAGSYNYYYTLTRNDNGTVDGFASPNDSKWDIGSCPKAGAAAGHFGMTVVQLPLYARTDARKHYLAQAVTGFGSGTGGLYAVTAGGWVHGTTDALTALILRPGLGQFAQGTLAKLWGVSSA